MNPASFENLQCHLKLYQELSQQPGNQFFSAHSLQRVLAPLLRGAGGATATEMSQALCVEGLEKDLGALFRELEAALKTSAGACLLREANRVWGREGLAFEKDFLEGLDQGSFQNADFSNKGALVKEINDWVSEQTEGKIPGIINENDIQELTLLILVNALYFKGRWEAPFDPKGTREQVFWVEPDRYVMTPMMNERKEQGDVKFNYLSKDGWDYLELPYESSQLAMLFVKPTVEREFRSIHELFGKLGGRGWTEPLHAKKSLDDFAMSADELGATIEEMKPENVLVNIPRFLLECGYNLIDPLKNMGMKQAFSELDADFHGVLNNPGAPLFIGLIIQKAFVEVNEEGTEAAAVTAVLSRAGGAPKINVFRADHPFLFFIRDRKSGIILFMGRVENPGDKELIQYIPEADGGFLNKLKGFWNKG